MFERQVRAVGWRAGTPIVRSTAGSTRAAPAEGGLGRRFTGLLPFNPLPDLAGAETDTVRAVMRCHLGVTRQETAALSSLRHVRAGDFVPRAAATEGGPAE